MEQAQVGKLIDRLRELREEYAAGEAQLRDLDKRRSELCDTMLRISGAIQVLEEMVAGSGAFGEPVAAAATNGEAKPR